MHQSSQHDTRLINALRCSSYFSGTYSCLSLPLLPDILFDVFSDGQLAGSLANLGQISAGKSFGHLGHEGQVHLLGEGTLPQVGLEDRESGELIGKGNVDQLVKTSGTKDGGIDDVGPVGCSDDEDVLFGTHTVHFGKDLIDDTISSSAGVTD